MVASSDDIAEKIEEAFAKREEFLNKLRSGLEEYKDILGKDYDAVVNWVECLRVEEDVAGLKISCGDAVTHPDSMDGVSKDIELLLHRTGAAQKLSNVGKAVFALARALKTVLPGKEAVRRPRLKGLSLQDRIKHIVSNISELLAEASGLNTDDFEKQKTEVKASAIYKLVADAFDVVRVPPATAGGESEVYVVVDNTLYDLEEVINPVVGALVKNAMGRRNLVKEVGQAAYSTTNIINWFEIDPWDKLNLANGVLDLSELRLKDTGGYFRHRLNVSITQEELDMIKGGSYDVKQNEIYRLWRNHFDDENWEYLVHSLGTWLAPHRTRHLAFIIGPRGVGKSTLLRALTSPILPVVANIPLNLLTDYTFGLEGLIGKQLNVYSERGEIVLRRLDLINNLVGEHDFIAVPRKYKPTTTIRSLKTMVFAMNDPPIVTEYGGETMAAFVDRLSIIEMEMPEDFKPRYGLEVDQKEAFKFLLWCRVQLERNGWQIKKMGDDEMLEYLMKTANSALQFLESEYVAPDPAGRVKGTELYDAYVAWCNEKGITPMGRNSFYTTVASKHRKYVREKTTWFQGLTLRQV
jgi:phage/plasmid-associated DNA primase